MNKNVMLLKKVGKKLSNKFKYYIEKYKYNKKIQINDKEKSILMEFKSDFKVPFTYFESLYEIEDNEILNKADSILQHNFDILGMKMCFKDKIHWNVDIKTNFQWKNLFYKDIKTVEFKNNSDVKVPWELSRFQHTYILVKAYEISNNKVYIKECENQILDWIKQNPYKGSVNWTCAMEVAIRACNWIVVIKYMDELDVLNENLKKKINISLYLHGEFIYNNLEKNILDSNNHYIADLIGLIWISLYFNNCSYKEIKNKSKKWLGFALEELDREIANQVFEEGVNYEISIPYHCLVTEMIAFTEVVLNANNKKYNNDIVVKLEQMISFIKLVTKKNNNIPLIGDMDSGRFIFFTSYNINDKRNFVHLIKYYNFKYNKNNNDDAKSKIVVKKKSGYAIYKNNIYYFISRCGMNAMNGQGNHNHNDNLSFELNIRGIDFIIDPGTFCYTQSVKMRNMYRSTSFHNTLQIEDIEQNDYNEKQLFKMKDQSEAKFHLINSKSILGEIRGYEKKCNIIHKRQFNLEDSNFELIDYLNDEKNKLKTINLFLDPNIDINSISKNKLELARGNIRLKIFSEKDISIKDGKVSPEYGVLIPTKLLSINFRGTCHKIRFIID